MHAYPITVIADPDLQHAVLGASDALPQATTLAREPVFLFVVMGAYRVSNIWKLDPGCNMHVLFPCGPRRPSPHQHNTLAVRLTAARRTAVCVCVHRAAMLKEACGTARV